MEQCGAAGLRESQAELAQSSGEAVCADRPSGLTSGKQPWRGSRVAEGGVAPSGCDEDEDETGERFGQRDGLAAQADAYLLLAGLDVVEGEAAEGGGTLGVEEDQKPGGTRSSGLRCRRGGTGALAAIGLRCR